MTTTLPLFWHLSSVSKKERIEASTKLVGALEHFQVHFVPKESPETEEDEGEEDTQTTDGLDVLNAQDVAYSIRRLVRGLASPRDSSRLGFAVALSELLSRLETVTCSQIVSLIVDASKLQGSMTGQEERDVLFARLFGLTAVIESGLLVRTKPLPTSASSSTLASNLSSYQETVAQLLALGEKKSWLRESAWWTLGLAIDALKESDVLWNEGAVDATIQSIFVENKRWSPEKVAMTLKLQRLYPERDWRKFLLPSFKNPDLLSTGNLNSLARILKESTTEEEDGKDVPKSTAGTWKPQVHFVWDIILDHLLPGPNSVHPPHGIFQEFFRVVVDESLFSSTSSQERKYWGFQIFQKALPRVAASNMPMLFTKNFMRSWINHLSHHDRYLHKVARQVAAEIQSFVQQNPQLGFALILQLTGVNGSHQFDKLTKTKTVELILTSMDSEGIKNYIEYLLKQVSESEGSEKTEIQTVNSRRSWIIDQFGALIRNSAIPKSDEWIQSILDWFVINGLFVIRKKSEKSPYPGLREMPKPAFSEELRQTCRTRLLSCLADLTSQTTLIKSGDKTMKALAVSANGEFWVSRVLATVEQLETDTRHVTLLVDADDNTQALRNKAREVLAKLRKVPGSQQETPKGAELLLTAILLQQYCTDEEEEGDINTLEACIDGASRMFLDIKKGSKSRKSIGDDTEPTPEPVDVLIDVIIGFLEKSTAYMRTVGNQVFSLLSGAVQESTIDLILTQLERRNPAELAEDDENMDEEYDDSDGKETEGEDGGEDEQSSEDDKDDDDDNNDDDVDVELRNKIEEALRVNGIEAATGDSDEYEDEDLMDDEQMMAIDAQLAEVFRSRANEKKMGKNIDAQREATHFKNRVLDLVDTFLKKQPTSLHVVRFILPLIELIVGSSLDERQLSDKARGMLRARVGKSKEIPSGVNMEQITHVLNELHIRARKVHSPDVLAALSQCSLYLSKVMLYSEGEGPILQAYRESLADFITRKNSALNANFFQDFIRRFPASGWNIRDDLIQLSKESANVYRRYQAFQLLQVLVSQLPSLDNRQQEIEEFMSSLRKALFGFISDACDEKVTLTAVQMKELFKLGLLAIRQTRRVTSALSSTEAIWEPNTWITLHGRLAIAEHFKTSPALQTMCKQMAQSATPSAKSKVAQKPDFEAAVAKRKADDTAGDEDGSTKTKRKRAKKAKV